MKTMKPGVRKGILIIGLWLVFLAAAGLIIYRIQYRVFQEETETELVQTARSIGVLLPVMEENDQYAKQSIGRAMSVRMDPLAFVLAQYDNMEDAGRFLEGFRNVAALENLVVFDTRGKVVYGDSDFAEELSLDADEIGRLIRGEEEAPEDYRIGMASVGRRWLAVGKNRDSSSMKSILDFFNWETGLTLVTGDRNTVALMVSTEDGSIMTAPDTRLIGQSITDASLQSGDGTAFRDVSELTAFFADSTQAKSIRLGGVSWLAARVTGSPEEVLLLVMRPKSYVSESARGITLPLFIAIFLVSGVFTAYAYFRPGEPAETDGAEEKNRFTRNRKLAASLGSAGVIALLAIFGFTLYSEMLLVYSGALIGNRARIENALTLYDGNREGAEMLEKWADEEYLIRTRIAQCVLAELEDAEITRDALKALSEALEVQAITVYDKNGVVQATSSSYAPPILDEDSPFYPLLEGRKTIIGTPEEDEMSGDAVRKIGASLIDTDGEPIGCILVSEDLNTQMKLERVTRYDYLFRQLAAPTDSRFAVSEQEKDELLYLAKVLENGYDEYSSEDSLLRRTIQELGLREEQLQDSYNGSINYDDESYILSVRQKEGNWLILMKKTDWIAHGAFRLVIGNALAFLVYMLILIAVCSRPEKEETLTEEAEKPPAEEPAKNLGDPSLLRDATLRRLGSFLYQDKPFFEERWPNESKKWQDKTPSEKFRLTAKALFIFFMLCLTVQSMRMGEKSMLQSSLRGEWSFGFNLHSLTTVLITVSWLITAKIIIHGILYLFARAANPKGETICHLLDSFSGYALVMAGFFICLGQLGFDTAKLSLSAGVLGVIVGIGGANLISDILAGIVMVFEGAVHAGDIVYFEDNRYYVVSIGVRTTKLKIYGKTTVVRNDDFRNYVRVPIKGKVEVSVSFRTALSESVTRVEEIIHRELPGMHERIVRLYEDAEGPFYWGVDEITDNWMSFCVYLSCNGVDCSDAEAALNAEVMMMCERNAIEMPSQTVILQEAPQHS